MAISEKIYPRTGDTQTVYLKSVITDASIQIGDYTMYNDFVHDPRDFQRNNVLYYYPINSRIDNRAVKTLITKIAEEWVMINSRGFQENATFQRIQLFCFFYFRNSGCKGTHFVV